MSSDFTLHVDLTDSQRAEILAEYQESDIAPLEHYL